MRRRYALDYWTDDGKASGSVLVSGNGYPEACMIRRDLGTDRISFHLRALTISEAAGTKGISADEWLRGQIAARAAREARS